jgi:bifunctional non-homologous end joining protein LigD
VNSSDGCHISFDRRRLLAYEPGKRTGLWSKHRIEQGQEFVIGGYTPGSNGFDALIVGFYHGKDLLFAARVLRASFQRLGAKYLPRSSI